MEAFADDHFVTFINPFAKRLKGGVWKWHGKLVKVGQSRKTTVIFEATRGKKIELSKKSKHCI